jgi:hypothetical protein
VGAITPSIAGAGTLSVAILTGIGALGSLGAIIGALIGACRPEYEAKRYEGRMRSAGVLLSVHCDNADWRIRAKHVLRNTGARSVASTSESKADFGRSEKPNPRARVKQVIRPRTFLRGSRPVPPAGEPLSAKTPLVGMEEAGRRPAD